MQIYPNEIQSGISEQVAKASITICSPIKVNNVAKANEEHSDIYPLTSVLVSTGWNGNDDVFDSAELWKARHTAKNKKIDFAHDELTIIGHISDAYCVGPEGRIEDDAETPEMFDIITAGYLYTFWQDEERHNLVAKIINEIPSNEWFVSMECIFDNFDYAIKKGDESWIIQRNEQTSFLTAKLRMFGGDGMYNGYRVGRLLRDFTFSGKGIVKNPANPNSIILNNEKFSAKEEKTFFEFASSSVYPIKEIDMSLEAELKEAKDIIAKLEAEKVATASKQYDIRISTLEAQLATASADKEAVESRLSVTQEAIKLLETQLAEAKKACEEAETAKKDMEMKAKTAVRKASLVEAGVAEADAAAYAEKWVEISDEVFTDFVVAMKNKQVIATKEAVAEVTTENTLEETETVEETVISTVEDVDDSLIKAVAEYYEANRKTNKGEK